MSLTRRAAESDLDLARNLTSRLPSVFDALREGTIDLRRALVIVDGTSHLDDAEARSVAEAVLAESEGRTTGQLRRLIRRLCIEADPDDADRRYRTALEQRRVVAELGDDTTASIIASDLPSDRVATVIDRVDRIARGLRTAGEQRSIDQLRADVLLDARRESDISHGGHARCEGRSGHAHRFGEPGRRPGWVWTRGGGHRSPDDRSVRSIVASRGHRRCGRGTSCRNHPAPADGCTPAAGRGTPAHVCLPRVFPAGRFV